MTLALLTGLGFGVGVWLLVLGLRPAPLTATARLRLLDHPAVVTAPTAGVAPPTDGLNRLRLWLGLRALPATDSSTLAVLTGDVTADLAVTGTAAELHAGSKALSALTGLLTPALLTGLLLVAGLTLPLLVPLWLCLTAAVVGYLLPDLRLRRAAADAPRPDPRPDPRPERCRPPSRLADPPPPPPPRLGER